MTDPANTESMEEDVKLQQMHAMQKMMDTQLQMMQLQMQQQQQQQQQRSGGGGYPQQPQPQPPQGYPSMNHSQHPQFQQYQQMRMNAGGGFARRLQNQNVIPPNRAVGMPPMSPAGGPDHNQPMGNGMYSPMNASMRRPMPNNGPGPQPFGGSTPMPQSGMGAWDDHPPMSPYPSQQFPMSPAPPPQSMSGGPRNQNMSLSHGGLGRNPNAAGPQGMAPNNNPTQNNNMAMSMPGSYHNSPIVSQPMMGPPPVTVNSSYANNPMQNNAMSSLRHGMGGNNGPQRGSGLMRSGGGFANSLMKQLAGNDLGGGAGNSGGGVLAPPNKCMPDLKSSPGNCANVPGFNDMEMKTEKGTSGADLPPSSNSHLAPQIILPDIKTEENITASPNNSNNNNSNNNSNTSNTNNNDDNNNSSNNNNGNDSKWNGFPAFLDTDEDFELIAKSLFEVCIIFSSLHHLNPTTSRMVLY